MWRHSGDYVKKHEIAALNLPSSDSISDPSHEMWRTVRISLFKCTAGADWLGEEYLSSEWGLASAWIATEADNIRAISSSGIQSELLVDLWIDVDQMELAIPVNLLTACAEANLPIHIITND